MSMHTHYQGFSRVARQFRASALALAAALGGYACASSGTAAGTYRGTAPSNGGGYANEPSGVHINVDLSERMLYLRDGHQTVSAYKIGVGRDEMPTPVGDYSVRRIVWNPPWSPPDAAWADGKEPQPPGAPDNPMKVVKIYFHEPDYYIHGTGTESSLGEAVSHGCLRMAPADAASLARYLMDHGGAPRSDSWFRSVQASNETQTVVLPEGIPMHVAN